MAAPITIGIKSEPPGEGGGVGEGEGVGEDGIGEGEGVGVGVIFPPSKRKPSTLPRLKACSGCDAIRIKGADLEARRAERRTILVGGVVRSSFFCPVTRCFLVSELKVFIL